MNRRTLVLQSLRHRWRAHLGVLLGAAIGSAALIGALVVGDSVRGSLRAQALERLGWIDVAIAPVDRFFTPDLAPALTNSGALQSATTALRLPATAARQDGAARANRVQLLGVPPEFWPAGNRAAFAAMPRGSVQLNEALASQLNARPGDSLVLRVHKPSTLSREVPITPQNDASIALRLKVHRIVPASELGHFNLQSSQAPPLNAFVHLADLDAPAGLAGKINLLLGALPGPVRNSLGTDPASAKARSELAALDKQIALHARLADFALELRPVTNPASPRTLELRTDRIFLDAPVTAAALATTPGETAPQPILTYLVNQIRASQGDRSVPYSMVTAATPPLVPADLAPDEILVNQWLAGQLAVAPGDVITLAYYLPESGAKLVERTNQFRVRAIVPMDGPQADRSLMPEFPGLAKAESTHDWDAGFPLVHKIRDEDEAYWKQYRGTPKALVSWAAGQTMWTNRFGNATAVRFARPAGGSPETDTIARPLAERLNPGTFGLQFQPVRAQALAGSAQAQDFGGLFLGFSFFLILAALILMSLLFQFGLEQRTAEIGTLLALGYTPKRVRRLLLAEGTLLATVGGLAGVAGGIAYAQAMLRGLSTIWREAIGGSSLQFFVTPATLGIGLVASIIVGSLSIALVLRRQARRPARELLADGAGLEDSTSPGSTKGGPARPARTAAWTVLASGGAGLGLVAWALAAGENASAQVFFGAGSLLLIAGLAGAAVALRRLERAGSDASAPRFAALGWRAAARRRKRSLASMALLACGSFLIVAVGANRLDADRDASQRSSGTGGFALIGESSLPVLRDLNTAAGREFYGLDDRRLEEVSIVPFRVRDGDEASCLNLNRAQQPRLLGVDPALLASRNAFTFAKVLKGLPTDRPWTLLQAPLPPDSPESQEIPEIPAIGDAASIQWALGKKLGDTLEYTDERGARFRVRLVAGVANSILQGNLVIDETEFARRFPGESGHRMFLIDVPSKAALTNVAATLTRGLQDTGLELTPAAQHLAAFNAVQNTYLNTFQILGGLGLLLGSAGLGVVVLRNVLERRGELALLRAVGFRRRRLHRLVLGEHAGLLAAGLAVGIIAALVAVLPVLLAPGAALHATALGLTLAGVLLSGFVWTWLATRFALRGPLLDALRHE